MKLAYLNGQYPKVSHTFIRREILALEALGHEVVRLSVRQGDSGVVDPGDVAERERTHVFFDASPVGWATALFAASLRVPASLSAEVARAISRGLSGVGPGVGRRLAYVVEAAWFLGIVRREGVSHVHAHFGRNAASVARILEGLGGPRFSMTVHGPDEFDDPRGHELGEKVDASVFTAAISHFTSGQLRRWAGTPSWQKLQVVRCSIDEAYGAGAPDIAQSADTFVCLGRLCAQKGQLVLLEAFASVIESGVDARLVFAGDGEMRPDVEARVAELSLEGRVEITGWIDEHEVRERLVASRCMVLPSFAEGLPVSIMEALALRRPVISTYIAGIPELVDESCGWLVPSGDVAALASALREAAATPTDELDAMGARGAARVRKQHDLETEARRLDALFRALAS
jgi:glycosyltransferase involved in cell wall biosynthesis